MSVELSTRSKLIEQWSFALLVSCCYILVYGYRFNCGDQSEHLPQVYQHLNPELYKGDFFLTYYDKTFTVRYYWVAMVSFLSKMLPVSTVCFGLYLFCLITCVFSWIRISLHFTESKWASYLSVFFIFILFNTFTVGGNQLQGNMFVGSSVAEALASLGIYMFVSKKYNATAVFFGAASLFQVLIGLHLFIILFIVLFFSKEDNRVKKIFFYSFIYCITAIPIFFPLMGKQFFITQGFDEVLYYRILYVFRGIMHYRPSLFPITDYIKMIVLLIPSLIILYTVNVKNKRMIAIVLITIITGSLLYTIVFEYMDLKAIGKIQWFKNMVWLNCFCCIVITGALTKYSGKYFSFSFVLLKSQILLGFSAIMLIILTNSSFLPLNKLRDRYQIGNYQKTDIQIVHEWIKQNTPVDVMFLVAPSDDAFACEAQRSQPVNYKAIVHQPYFFMEWYKRMKDYYNVDFGKVGNSLALMQAEYNYCHVLRYPSNNEAVYRIDNIKASAIISQLGDVVYQKGDWIVTKINNN